MATESPPPSPPPPPPKESFLRRNKFIFPLLIALNFSIGVYLYTRPHKEEKKEGETPATAVTSTALQETFTAVSTTSPSPPAIQEPRKPIPVEQQRELFKWMLEEKRKVKTNDPQEKKRIDEEKALLKQFIRSKSIPSL